MHFFRGSTKIKWNKQKIEIFILSLVTSTQAERRIFVWYDGNVAAYFEFIEDLKSNDVFCFRLAN